MRSVIESEMPLIVAVQHAKSGLFSDFHFSCFEWILFDKLFRSQSFNLPNLCAAGTEEGPILLISKLAQSIVPVCLLCVHKRGVTDIAMSLQINTFLSVSSDGSIAGWHCQDGTCCFVYENLVQPGLIKILLCASDSSQAWFWVQGKCASLVNLKDGSIIQNISFPGLTSFSILSRHSSLSVNQNLAIMTGINSTRTYQVHENNTLTLNDETFDDFVLGESAVACPNGIIRYKDNFFSVFMPNIAVPVFSDFLNDISKDDSISYVEWDIPDTLLIGTFNGYFRVYKLQGSALEQTQQFQVTRIISFSHKKCCIFSNVAYTPHNGVIFASSSKTVISISEDSKVVKLVMPRNNKLCCIPDSKSRIVIQSDFKSSSFQLFDWSNPQNTVKTYSIITRNIPISQSVDFRKSRSGFLSAGFMNTSNVRITALSCHIVNLPSQRIQIIAGGSDGKLYFFWENNKCPADIVNSLVAPIIGIAHLPIKFAGRSCLIAIGSDGTFCLFKWTKLSLIFASNCLPIVSVSFIESQQLIVVEKIDNSFYIYDLNDPLPLSVTTYLPQGSKIIWSRVKFPDAVDVSSTLSLHIAGASLFYSVIEVSKLKGYLIENNEIPKDFQNTIRGVMEMMSPMVRTRSVGNFSKKYNSESTSFVLLGYRNLPTFFYPMYKLSGSKIFDTSPYNACLHYLTYTLMADFLGYDIDIIMKDYQSKICGFISILTQFLFVSDEKVQKIAALTCIKAIGAMTENNCQEMYKSYIQYFNKKNLADYDKYLMGIIIANHSEFVPQDYHKLVFDFIMKMSLPSHPSSPLAFSLLLSDFNFWEEIYNKKYLMTQIIKIYYYQKDTSLFEDRFFTLITQQFSTFSTSIMDIIEESPLSTTVRWICQLCTAISIAKPSVVGTLGALTIAHLGSSFYQYNEIFEEELKKQKTVFLNKIANEEPVWIISTDDGFVHIFKNSKFLFKEKIFESPIHLLSIGPKALFAAAISVNEKIMKIFDLKSKILSVNKKHVTATIPLKENENDAYKIVWTGKDMCTVENNDS
ncbi:hypothetical protein TRFO_32708 [Tritrichomonas foetus]|uniref:Uncharacterized protein n=1 Tax=Tritrichomonas foetus TaxID=1144522 RepID=A0A1J4JNE0_9EUKA|nr:hypothetical protein TRFO_32708 [Tritrichomonas foetus]|eukprot:OHT00595.1 hypothetical protein TRFO_32708 [Tritrichomonas foetus]